MIYICMYGENDYLYGMLNSEEHTVEVLTFDLHEEKCLRDALDPAKEPELLKVVNYALKEYPCILHCLEDGLQQLLRETDSTYSKVS